MSPNNSADAATTAEVPAGFKGILYPVTRPQRVLKRVVGHFFSVTRLHLVTAYPGELEFRELIQDEENNEGKLGEAQRVPCPFSFNDMLTLPRKDRPDLLLVVFAPVPRRWSTINYQIMGYESGAFVGKRNYNVAAKVWNSEKSLVECVVFGSKVVSIVDNHTLVAFQYDTSRGLLSDIVSITDETKVLAKAFPLNDDTILVSSYGPGYRASWRAINLNEARGKLGVAWELDLSKSAFSDIIDSRGRTGLTSSGADGLLFHTYYDRDEHSMVVNWIQLEIGVTDSRGKKPELKSASCGRVRGDEFLFGQESVQYHDPFHVIYRQPKSDGVGVAFVNDYFSEPLPTLYVFHNRKAYYVGECSHAFKEIFNSEKVKFSQFIPVPERGSLLICVRDGVFEMSYKRRLQSRVPTKLVEPKKHLTEPERTLRLLDSNGARTYYILGTHPDYCPGKDKYFIDVQRISKVAAYTKLGELSGTSSASRIFGIGNLLVVSTRRESRFLRISSVQSSLISQEINGWQTQEPTLCVFDKFQVTPSGFFSEDYTQKVENPLICAASQNRRCVVVYEEGTKWHADVFDACGSRLIRNDDLSRSYSNRIVDVAITANGAVIVAFSSELLVGEESTKLSNATERVVAIGECIYVGTTDGHVVIFEGSDQRKLTLGTTPVSVMHCGTLVVASCISKTLVINGTLNGCGAAPLYLDQQSDIVAATSAGNNQDLLAFAFADKDRNVEIFRIADSVSSDYYECEVPSPAVNSKSAILDPDRDEIYLKFGEGIFSAQLRTGQFKRVIEWPEETVCVSTGASWEPGHPHAVNVIVSCSCTMQSWKACFKIAFPKLRQDVREVFTDELTSEPERIWALPCRTRGVARVRCRTKAAKLVDLTITESDVVFSKEFNLGTGSPDDFSFQETYLVPDVNRIGHINLSLYDLETGALYEGYRATRPFDASLVDDSSATHKPLVITSSNGEVELFVPNDSTESPDRQLDPLASAKMTNQIYMTRGIERWESLVSRTETRVGVEPLRPLALVAGKTYSDVYLLFGDVDDAATISELMRLDEVLRRDLQSPIPAFNETTVKDDSRKLINGSLLSRFYNCYTQEDRRPVYKKANIDPERGDAILSGLEEHCGLHP